MVIVTGLFLLPRPVRSPSDVKLRDEAPILRGVVLFPMMYRPIPELPGAEETCNLAAGAISASPRFVVMLAAPVTVRALSGDEVPIPTLPVFPVTINVEAPTLKGVVAFPMT